MSKLLSCADRLRAKTVGQVTPQVAHLTFTVEELLRENVALTIPLWQRDYDWSETQYRSILSTLQDGGQSPFFGNILLLQNAEKGFLVVDGQQRLCTFFKLAHVLAKENSEVKAPTVHLMRGKTEEPAEPDDQKEEIVEGQTKAFFKLMEDIQKDIQEGTQEKKLLAHFLSARLAVTVMVPSESMMRDVKRLTSYATALFERVNTQKKALVPVDQLKARLLVTLVKEDAEAAESFATAWEQLRAIVWTNGANDPDVRNSIRDGDFGTVQKLGELAAEDLRRREMLFMRLLIGIALVSGGKTDGFSLSTESLEDARASFARREEICHLENPSTAKAFSETLRKVVQLLLEDEQVVLLHRTNKNAEHPPKLPSDERKLRLLQLQAFLEGTPGVRWSENQAFLTILKRLVEQPDDVESAMTAAEKFLWTWMRKKTDGKLDAEKHRRLVARDWFLFKSLWDKKSRTSFTAAISVALAQSKAKLELELDKTFLGKASALSTETAYIKRLPSRSGAAEIEHWVAVKSVTEAEQKKIGKFINTSANYAHIANGLNQRLSNLPSQDKASVVLSKEIFESCWPTLLFNAWATESLKTEGGSVEKLALLQFFESFWAAVAEELPEG